MTSQSGTHENQPAVPTPDVAKSLFDKEEVVISTEAKIARGYGFELLRLFQGKPLNNTSHEHRRQNEQAADANQSPLTLPSPARGEGFQNPLPRREGEGGG